ncbi:MULTISPECIES: hypothetical protein [Bradyrhizobium]|uniref:hypothetical protein n=1 Tax=Bradyrhizobium TaxID=374 RepID=UPI00040BA6AF|nr:MULTISPECIES: hypothetical protein [Bradyrhizobium]UFW50434.1 hypothetical protein BaraCB756_05020 [Bradyrhizobium arachidis]
MTLVLLPASAAMKEIQTVLVWYAALTLMLDAMQVVEIRLRRMAEGGIVPDD